MRSRVSKAWPYDRRAQLPRSLPGDMQGDLEHVPFARPDSRNRDNWDRDRSSNSLILCFKGFITDTQHLNCLWKSTGIQWAWLMKQRCNVALPHNCFCQSTLDQLQLPYVLQGLPLVKHIAVIHPEGDQSMRNYVQCLPIQEMVQLIHNRILWKAVLTTAAFCWLSRICESKRTTKFHTSSLWSSATKSRTVGGGGGEIPRSSKP